MTKELCCIVNPYVVCACGWSMCWTHRVSVKNERGNNLDVTVLHPCGQVFHINRDNAPGWW